MLFVQEIDEIVGFQEIGNYLILAIELCVKRRTTKQVLLRCLWQTIYLRKFLHFQPRIWQWPHKSNIFNQTSNPFQSKLPKLRCQPHTQTNKCCLWCNRSLVLLLLLLLATNFRMKKSAKSLNFPRFLDIFKIFWNFA